MENKIKITVKGGEGKEVEMLKIDIADGLSSKGYSHISLENFQPGNLIGMLEGFSIRLKLRSSRNKISILMEESGGVTKTLEELRSDHKKEI